MKCEATTNEGRQCSCAAWYYWKLTKSGHEIYYTWLCGNHAKYWKRRGWKLERWSKPK